MHRVRVRVSLSLKCKVNEKRTQLLAITLYQLAGPVSEEGEEKRGEAKVLPYFLNKKSNFKKMK